MRAALLLTFFLVIACATTGRKPSSILSRFEMDPTAMPLAQALKEDSTETLAYLKTKVTAKPYDTSDRKNPAKEIPLTLLSKPTRSAPSEEKRSLQSHLRKFHRWSFTKKTQRGQELASDFKCELAPEAQAMAFSLERNFPEPAAEELALNLHEKILSCKDYDSSESLMRLSVFSIHRDKCDKAMDFLDSYPESKSEGVVSRIAYLQSFCESPTKVENINPWSGYGILVSDIQIPDHLEQAFWTLSGQSGSEDWDRVLATFIELVEKEHHSKIRFIAAKLDFDQLRDLHPSFQTSMLTLFHYAHADLQVFQALNPLLAEYPQLVSKDILSILYPVRYWDTIRAQSKKTDPLLVKALIRQESAFNPKARSPARAYGLMQVIYPTARIFGVRSRAQLYKPETNVRVGTEYLARLIQRFGSVELALAAYNAGPNNVKAWMKRYPTTNINLFVEMIPYAETREYVRLVLRNYKIYQKLILEPSDKQDLAQVL